MNQIRTRNDRYSPLYQLQSGLTALCFVVLIWEGCSQATSQATTTANADTIQRGSGR